MGITADMLTATGLVFAAATAVAVATGHLHLAIPLLVLTGFHDLLDGPVAKASGTSSVRGAFFDSVTDRVADALDARRRRLVPRGHPSGPSGLAALRPAWRPPRWSPTSGPRPSRWDLAAKGGLMERAERMILLGVGFLSSMFLVPVLWVLLALTGVTALGRFVRVWRLAEAPLPTVESRRHRRARSHRIAARPAKELGQAVAVAGTPAGGVGQSSGAHLAGEAGPSGPAGGSHPRRSTPYLSLIRAVQRAPGGCMRNERLVYRTYTVLGRALSALPEPVALAGAACRGRCPLPRPARASGHGHGQPSAGVGRAEDNAADAAILDRWARRSFQAYARYWVEGARLGRTPRHEVVQRTFVQGLHHLVDGMAAGNGVIMALPHVGSWEYGGAFLAHQDLPMTSVAERIEPPELFDFFVEQRAAIGLTVIPLDATSGKAVLGDAPTGRSGRAAERPGHRGNRCRGRVLR